MKDISEAARRPPTAEETAEATEILEFIGSKRLAMSRVALLAYFLREAEEAGRQKERDRSICSAKDLNSHAAGQYRKPKE